MRQLIAIWISGSAGPGLPTRTLGIGAVMFYIAKRRFFSEAGKVQRSEFRANDEGVAGLFGLEFARLNDLYSEALFRV